MMAMAAVFVLLSLLATVMDLITKLFPEHEVGIEPVLVAAISTTVASVYPGARVTRIEEEK